VFFFFSELLYFYFFFSNLPQEAGQTLHFTKRKSPRPRSHAHATRESRQEDIRSRHLNAHTYSPKRRSRSKSPRPRPRRSRSKSPRPRPRTHAKNENATASESSSGAHYSRYFNTENKNISSSMSRENSTLNDDSLQPAQQQKKQQPKLNFDIAFSETPVSDNKHPSLTVSSKLMNALQHASKHSNDVSRSATEEERPNSEDSPHADVSPSDFMVGSNSSVDLEYIKT